MEGNPTRLCGKCSQIYPVEHFPLRSDGKRRDWRCRECEAQRGRERTAIRRADWVDGAVVLGLKHADDWNKLVQLAWSIIRAFGGVEQFAVELRREYDRATPARRARMIRYMITSIGTAVTAEREKARNREYALAELG